MRSSSKAITIPNMTNPDPKYLIPIPNTHTNLHPDWNNTNLCDRGRDAAIRFRGRNGRPSSFFGGVEGGGEVVPLPLRAHH